MRDNQDWRDVGRQTIGRAARPSRRAFMMESGTYTTMDTNADQTGAFLAKRRGLSASIDAIKDSIVSRTPRLPSAMAPNA